MVCVRFQTEKKRVPRGVVAPVGFVIVESDFGWDLPSRQTPTAATLVVVSTAFELGETGAVLDRRDCYKRR